MPSAIAGSTRYTTSAAVVDAVVAKTGGASTVLLATGNKSSSGAEFQDALSASSWAYANAAPIMLVDPNSGLTAAQVASVKATKATDVVIVGDTTSVPEAVKGASQLGSGFTYERVAGSDVYETSALMAAWSIEHGSTAANPAIATGENYPDALVGSALTGKNNSVLVLVKDASSPGIAELAKHADDIQCGYTFGGTYAISDDLQQAVLDAVGGKLVG